MTRRGHSLSCWMCDSTDLAARFLRYNHYKKADVDDARGRGRLRAKWRHTSYRAAPAETSGRTAPETALRLRGWTE